MGNKERKGGKICGARNFDVFYTIVVIWSWSFGHFRFRKRGYLLTIYKYNIYIIVADFDSPFSILTNDQMTK